jgi:hypothetical protein
MILSAFVLKKRNVAKLTPPTQRYTQLSELENLTLHQVSIAKIVAVPHRLIRMKSGKLAYITKQIDCTILIGSKILILKRPFEKASNHSHI